MFEFIVEDFQLKTYGFAILFLFFLLYINYFSPFKGNYFTVEERVASIYLTKNLLYFLYLPFYAIPYFLILIYKLYVEKSLFHFRNPLFWLKITIILFILCLDGGFYFDSTSLQHLPIHKQVIINEFVNGAHSFITVFLIIIIVYYLFDVKNPPFLYGISFSDFNPKPYFILLLSVASIVFYASFNQEFLDQYPTLSGPFIQNAFGLSKNTLVSLYEIVYILDFINVELLMRGLMVIGLAGVIGRHAILPTTIVYVLLHFERPIAESIGALFGGYALGIIAYKSRNILGGCMIHMGIAGLMELFAFLHKN